MDGSTEGVNMTTWWVLGTVAVGVLVSALVSVVLFGLVAARVLALERRIVELEASLRAIISNIGLTD